MKTKLTLLALLITVAAIAQTGINYKAVIKDDLGNNIANDLVQVEFTILQGAGQTTVYTETHTPTTDDNGIIIVTIGEGTTNDIFEAIEWSTDDHFLNIQIDTGNGLVDLGTTKFKHVPYAITANNVKGLEPLDEGNGIGWRLIGRDLDNYGDVGFNAIDLSYSVSPVTEVGALGDYTMAAGAGVRATGTFAVAMGFNTEASGVNSFAMGSSTTASGNSSVAMGGVTTASGFASLAMGENTTASGATSIATGFNTEAIGDHATATGDDTIASGVSSFSGGEDSVASGNYSVAVGLSNEASGFATTSMGRDSNASGDYSTTLGYLSESSGFASTATGLNTTASGYASKTMGSNTTAHSYVETTIGSFNTPYTPNNATTWNANDRLFVIGNGDSPTNRSNALIVLKNGNIGMGVNNPDEILHIDGRLKIGSETIEDGGNNNLRFNASLFPDNDNVMRLGSSSLRWTSVWATDGTINTSDRRSKTNIATLKYGLKDVMQLNPVSFNWKTNPNNDTKLGLIAQDLLNVIPEVVKTHELQTDENGIKLKTELERMGVYYSDLVPVLIKAIQEQQEIIAIQKVENSEQTLEISSINKALKTLMSRIETLESNSSNYKK